MQRATRSTLTCLSLATVAAVGLAAAPASADVIVQYGFDGGTQAPTQTDPNATATAIDFPGLGDDEPGGPTRFYDINQPLAARTNGDGALDTTDFIGIATGGNGGGGSFRFDARTNGDDINASGIYGDTAGVAAAFQDSIDGEGYFEFTISPEPGFQLQDLTTLTFDHVRSNGQASRSDAIQGMGVRFSTDGSTFMTLGTTGADLAENTTYETFTFSNVGDTIANAMLDEGEDLTFRFYIFTTSDGSTRDFVGNYDNFTLNGEVVAAGVIPEPASLALLGLGGLMLLPRGKRA